MVQFDEVYGQGPVMTLAKSTCLLGDLPLTSLFSDAMLGQPCRQPDGTVVPFLLCGAADVPSVPHLAHPTNRGLGAPGCHANDLLCRVTRAELDVHDLAL